MEDLIDIQGLDHIGWWPLALGWWIVIAIALAVIILGLYFLIRWIKYRKSWQYKAFMRLAHLHAQIAATDHKQVLQNLSMEMRKIAMLSTKRESCAGLIGPQWLQWLQEHDPLGFDWQTNGALLVDAQYMPNAELGDATQLSNLITAAQGWVKKC